MVDVRFVPVVETWPQAAALIAIVVFSFSFMAFVAWLARNRSENKESAMSDIQLGSQVIHSVTGFTGIATGRAIYLSGCVNLLVKPKVDKEGKMREGHWIDENELEVVEAAEHEELKPTGGPRPEEPPK